MNLALPHTVAAGGELRPLFPPLYRLEVVNVLIQDAKGGIAVVWRAMTRHHYLRLVQ